MCLPAAAAIPLAIASTAVSAGGQIMSGLQQKAQGKYEQQVATINQQQEAEAARQSQVAGQTERLNFWRKVGALKGSQVAAMAANGIDTGFGIGERTQEDTQALANEDAKNLYGQIDQRTRGHLIDASNFKAEGDAALRRGKDAFTNSLFGAAATVLGGASQIAGMKAKMKAGG